ncbi:hypothetical protein BABINDRAFT_152346 [Babjeviella inositovora NRRL Y-12698]|uniref:Transcription initiation factor TFIID subunit 10 n=1 Tax=Babjeviella inositovora NRRL Y-12698 TaxID=984486 RepID=A0A1E3QLZ4_9ASCO|nr:uncharacterized protein BABINDRAFT_152346 [Babjeviella inositovora NRRL Y-12698]ODQ78713.1 hypothetical protein BABINDRAFT_152346 [Babjeviella inositovora NRRL Y-12698]
MPDANEAPPSELDMDVDEEINKEDALFDESEGEDLNGNMVPELPQLSRKDKTLKEIVDMMDDFAPIIPDAVTDYYLAKNGFDCSDVKIKRVLALATQKFISDIATDAYEFSRIRSVASVSNSQAKARQLLASQQAGSTSSGGGSTANQAKIVLTMEDLSAALSEYGLNVNKPEFYR